MTFVTHNNRWRLSVSGAAAALLTGGILLLSGCAHPGGGSSTHADNDRWAVAEGAHHGLPLLIRFRPGLFDRPDRERFPMRLSVVWEYSDSPSGMPSRADSDEMNQFEDHLVNRIESSGHGVIAAAITNAGNREWVFYVADDLAETTRLVHSVPQQEERYPITLERSPDPGWESYSSLLEGIR